MYENVPSRRRRLAGYLGACNTVPAVTTSVNCANAQASMNQMNSTYAALGSPSQYADQIQSINDTWAAAYPVYSWSGIDFNTFGMCATAFQIGVQADTLTNQMLMDAGQATVPGPTCGGSAGVIELPSLPGITTGLLGIGALAVVSYMYFNRRQNARAS